MNAILGFAQLLKMSPREALTENQEFSVDSILKGGNFLLGLIDQVLELNIIEAGKVSLNFDHVPAREVIDESLHMIQARADQENIELIDQTAGKDLPLL